MEEEVNGAEDPEERMQPEKGKCAHQQAGHGEEHKVEKRVMLTIRGIGMRNVLGEFGRGPFVTLAAGLNDIGR